MMQHQFVPSSVFTRIVHAPPKPVAAVAGEPARDASACESSSSDGDDDEEDERVAPSARQQQQQQRRHRETVQPNRHRHHHSRDGRLEERARGQHVPNTASIVLEHEQQLGALQVDMKKLKKQRMALENLKLALDYGVVTQEEFVTRARTLMQIDEVDT